MGAQSQIPNMAGKIQNKSPEGVSGIARQGPAPSAQPSSYTGVRIEHYHVNSTEDRADADLARRQLATYQPQGQR